MCPSQRDADQHGVVVGMLKAEIKALDALDRDLGFKLDGILRDDEWLYDHFLDIAVYSLLASEWKEIR